MTLLDDLEPLPDEGPEPMEDQEFFYQSKLALQKYWWQAKKPKKGSIGRELSAVKQWRKEVDDDGLLIRALQSYRGQPIAFLWCHKRGNRHLRARLIAKARQEQADSSDHISDGLRSFAKGILAGD